MGRTRHDPDIRSQAKEGLQAAAVDTPGLHAGSAAGLPLRAWRQKALLGVIARDVDAAVTGAGVEFGGIDKSDLERLRVNYAETNAIPSKAVQVLQTEVEGSKRDRTAAR